VVPLRLEGVESLLGGRGIARGVDEPEVGAHALAVLPRDEARRGADDVDDTGLEDGAREDGLDRLAHARQPVGAEHEDVLDPASAELLEDGAPELRALVLLDPHAEDFALTVHGNAYGEVYGAVLDGGLVSDLHHQRVEVDHAVDLF